MNRLVIKWIVLLLLVTAAGSSYAQHFGHDMRTYFDFGEQFYAAAEQTADASALDVRINTANALLSFLKTDKANSPRGAYYAIRDVSIELREKPAGLTLKALNIRDTIFTNTFASTTSKEAWNSMLRSIPLDGITLPQALEVHIEIRDGFLAHMANRPSTLDIAMRAFRHERPLTGGDSAYIGVSDVLILEKPVDAYTYRSKNFGAATEFSRDINAGLTIALQKNLKIDSLSISLTQTANMLQSKDFQAVQRASISVKPEDIFSDKVIRASSTDSEVVYTLGDSQIRDSVYRMYAALFSLPGKLLEVGKYRLDVKIRAGGTTRSFSQPIELEWHDMPLSLENPRDAIPPLQHITTDEEFKELSSGSHEEQLRKMYAFWKKQDPTPETAYNERMDEFYRRTDYAYFNFARGARLLDGAITDRGKIYILFGPPTNIERTFLLGEQPVEIWTYSNNVKKIVRFMDTGGHGDYKLVDVKSM
ncbi:MAG: GWxTD domain-containing protein [Bacteroidota bacterium]|nr:GWxTD domain-containing protein [Bacteroidota bacterium]MDP4230932.1 GWxTD domain-containing protein [Bacteroidota bacterium]